MAPANVEVPVTTEVIDDSGHKLMCSLASSEMDIIYEVTWMLDGANSDVLLLNHAQQSAVLDVMTALPSLYGKEVLWFILRGFSPLDMSINLSIT